VNPGWQDELRESLDISLLQALYSKISLDRSSKRQQKLSKEDKNPKGEGEREMKVETYFEEERAETARERMPTISENSKMPLQTKPKKNKPIHDHKRG
jgi:hypothetical protein